MPEMKSSSIRARDLDDQRRNFAGRVHDEEKGKQYVLKIGGVITFLKGYGPKLCAIGQVTSVANLQSCSQARARDRRTACEVVPAALGPARIWLQKGGRPCVEEVKMSKLITKVALSRDGILQASSARKLDKGG